MNIYEPQTSINIQDPPKFVVKSCLGWSTCSEHDTYAWPPNRLQPIAITHVASIQPHIRAHVHITYTSTHLYMLRCSNHPHGDGPYVPPLAPKIVLIQPGSRCGYGAVSQRSVCNLKKIGHNSYSSIHPDNDVPRMSGCTIVACVDVISSQYQMIFI